MIRRDSFKLGAAFSFASDFEDDLAIPMFDKKIGSLLAGCGFQILHRNTRLPHRHGKEVLPQSSHGFVHWPMEKAERWHQENFGLAEHIGSGRKDALQKKGLLEGFAVLLGFVFCDTEIFG